MTHTGHHHGSTRTSVRSGWRAAMVASVGMLVAIGFALAGPAGAQEPTTTTATTAGSSTTAGPSTTAASTTSAAPTTTADTVEATTTSSPYAYCTPPLRNRPENPAECYYPLAEGMACYDMSIPLASKPQWCQDFLATSTTTTAPGSSGDSDDSPMRPRRSGGARPQFTG